MHARSAVRVRLGNAISFSSSQKYAHTNIIVHHALCTRLLIYKLCEEQEQEEEEKDEDEEEEETYEEDGQRKKRQRT